MTHRYITEVVRILNDPSYEETVIYHYADSSKPQKLSCAVCLVGAFQVAVLKRSGEKAWQPFLPHESKFVPFRDASMGPCTYKLRPYEVVKGLDIAIRLGWYDFTTFDHLEYEYYERVQNGDLNWVIPGKFIAFMGPSGRVKQPDDHFKTTPEDYIKPFERWGVKHVVRLNIP